jgi:hypothetical protein
MNKFTLVVEKDETQLSPEQEILKMWNEFKQKNTNNININMEYEFYHKVRTNTDFDGRLIIDVMDKNK